MPGLILLLASFVMGPGPFFARPAESTICRASDRRQNPFETLRTIYEEVKELGRYPGEDFIKREFFLGFDDDDTNKDQHVVVLIQTLDGRDVMTIQATFMKKTKADPNIRLANDSKNLSCQIEKENVIIRRSDYDEAGLENLTIGLLKAVRDKKRLLKESDTMRRKNEA